MWRLEVKNLPAGVSHLIVDDEGVIALVKKQGRKVKAGALLAAAPEMLEALRAVVRVADRATVEFDMARAAIAKAEVQS